MNPRVRDKLCQILATYGPSLHTDPRRCENLLRDLCPQHKRELNVLIGALREGVPADLAAPTQRKTAIGAIGRFSKRLEDNLALAEVPARWAVETWALALGVVTAQQLAAAQPPQKASQQPKPAVALPPVIVARRQPATRSRAIVLTFCLILAGSGVVLAVSLSRPSPQQPTRQPAQVGSASTAVSPASSDATPIEIRTEPATAQAHAVSTEVAEAPQPVARASQSHSGITDEEAAIVRGALFPTLRKVAADSDR